MATKTAYTRTEILITEGNACPLGRETAEVKFESNSHQVAEHFTIDAAGSRVFTLPAQIRALFIHVDNPVTLTFNAVALDFEVKESLLIHPNGGLSSVTIADATGTKVNGRIAWAEVTLP